MNYLSCCFVYSWVVTIIQIWIIVYDELTNSQEVHYAQ